MDTNTNGLYYYKLDAETNGYSGDITKNCGLRGEEIDSNFNFLRGNDIESVAFDDDGNMSIALYNGETLTAQKTETPEYDFSYDSKRDILSITSPNGNTTELKGFQIKTDTFHDYTMEGSGTRENPIKIANTFKTGRYRSAIKLIDTTITNENGKQINFLPTENNKLNDRYVTREKINTFGRLYNISGLKALIGRLETINSEWRIPTKEDWDELLNSIETDDFHSVNTTNVYLGKEAGKVLKSKNYWKETDKGVLSSDDYGFSILPVGYSNVIGDVFYGSFGNESIFWTSTKNGEKDNYYVKCFNYAESGVAQRVWEDGYFLSIRLVKDYNDENGYVDSDIIDGVTVKTIHVPNQSLVWTQYNIDFSQPQYGGQIPEQWKEYVSNENEEIHYFVNDWNGSGWDKHELYNGDAVVLENGEHGSMHEWMLIDGELVDTLKTLGDELNIYANNVETKLQEEIDDLSNTVTNIKSELENKIQETSDKAETELNTTKQELENKIQETSDKAETELNTVKEKLKGDLQELEDRINTDLQTQINENKVVNTDNSLIIINGNTENNTTIPTNIKVKINTECSHIKLDENGIYFDGDFGTF